MYKPSLFRIVITSTGYVSSHASPSFLFTMSAIENSGTLPSFGTKSQRFTILISTPHASSHPQRCCFTAVSNRFFPSALSTTTK